MLSLDNILGLLEKYKYFAMFGVLFACGLGLPLPEEVTLIASGLAVGWEKANFLWASAACVAGILAGDAFIFAMGRYFGKRFLQSRPMRIVLSEKRQARIHSLFARRGNLAVFFARFLAGIRIGVYAYAGQHGMSWVRFLFLDLCGALLSGPTSIWIGSYAARQVADPQSAARKAREWIHEGSYVLYVLLGIIAIACLGHWWWTHRRGTAKPTAGAGQDLKARSAVPPPQGDPSVPVSVGTSPRSTSDPEAPRGG